MFNIDSFCKEDEMNQRFRLTAHYYETLFLTLAQVLRVNASGLGRWLRGLEYWLVLQRSWVRFSACTWWLTVIHNGEFDTLF